MAELGIGQLAKQTGIAIDTIRYYERTGLLSPQERSAAGYRRYTALELSRLRFIRRAQSLGFTLREIKELLDLSEHIDIAGVKRSAGAQVRVIDARIADLLRLREGLATLIVQCPGHGRGADCPILLALAGEEQA